MVDRSLVLSFFVNEPNAVESVLPTIESNSKFPAKIFSPSF
jgi:hypothetical protein